MTLKNIRIMSQQWRHQNNEGELSSLSQLDFEIGKRARRILINRGIKVDDESLLAKNYGIVDWKREAHVGNIRCLPE